MSLRIYCSIVVIMLSFGLGACEDDDPFQPQPTRAPRTISLAPDGTGEYPNIQAAINASIDGDTIALDNGRYDGPGNRDLDFGGRRFILKSQRGNPVFCLIGSDGQGQENYRGFRFHSGEDSLSIVENLTIEHGDIIVEGGAAVLCENGSSPTFRGVVFEQNRDVAVTCSGGSPTFTDCTFQNNIGGGLRCRGGFIRVTRCLFMQNYSDYDGAGLSIQYATVVVEDCVFLRNSAVFAGAGISSWGLGDSGGATLVVSGSQFIDNVSGYHGGAVDCMGTQFDFVACTFDGNQCGMKGGAFSCASQAGGIVTDCTFYGNSATEGAAINSYGDSLLTVENTIITFNIGSAAVICDGFGSTVPQLSCSTIYGNSGGDWFGCIEDQSTENNNSSVDPLFCDAESGDFGLRPESPLFSLPCGPAGGWPACAGP